MVDKLVCFCLEDLFVSIVVVREHGRGFTSVD